MKNQKRTAGKGNASTSGNMQTPANKARGRKLLTMERAAELADSIITHDEDEKARAFVELLEGIEKAAYSDRCAVDSIVLAATHRAYSKTPCTSTTA